jgi:hypothetical protein
MEIDGAFGVITPNIREKTATSTKKHWGRISYTTKRTQLTLWIPRNHSGQAFGKEA